MGDGLIYKQRFFTKVTDPAYLAKALKACADTHFHTKLIKDYGDLRGEISQRWCEDRLEPGRAWSNTAVALWTLPDDNSVGLIALIVAGVTVSVYLIYTGKISGGVTVPGTRSQIEVALEQW